VTAAAAPPPPHHPLPFFPLRKDNYEHFVVVSPCMPVGDAYQELLRSG